jgi:hypothetical protein
MALTGSINFRGIPLASAYARVERFQGHSKDQFQAFISTYANAESVGIGNELTTDLVMFTYDYTLPLSLNAQAYNAAKELPQFVGWSDC